MREKLDEAGYKARTVKAPQNIDPTQKQALGRMYCVAKGSLGAGLNDKPAALQKSMEKNAERGDWTIDRKERKGSIKPGTAKKILGKITGLPMTASKKGGKG